MDSVKRNVRLSESLYVVKGFGEHKQHVDELNRLVKSPASESSCLPSGFHEAKKLDMIEKPNIQFSERVPNKSMDSMLSGHTVYIESDISDELWNKVLETASKEGAIMVDRWFVGCGASLVACEVSSILRYIGHSNNIVTIGTLLENSQNQIVREICQTAIHAISRSILLHSICWSIFELTSSASIYTHSFSSEDASDHQSIFFDANGHVKDSGASFTNLTRSLVERFWITSMPFIRQGLSRIFTRMTILFMSLLMSLKEIMTAHEIESAIYTDSRHADWLRAVYSSRETVERGYVTFK
ncbi:hypothetical protein V6N13_050963 [Hibiscus sabdariffa]